MRMKENPNDPKTLVLGMHVVASIIVYGIRKCTKTPRYVNHVAYPRIFGFGDKRPPTDLRDHGNFLSKFVHICQLIPNT